MMKPRRLRPNPRVKAPPPLDKHYASETQDPRNTTAFWEHPPEEPKEERFSQLQLTAIGLWWGESTYEEIGRVLYDKDGEHDPRGAAKAKSVIQMIAKRFDVGIKDLKEAILVSRLKQIEDELRARGMSPEVLLYEAIQRGRRSS